MVKTHALIESISANLGCFLNLITPDLKKPQKKFIRDAVIGLIRAGRPIVCRMARNLPQCRVGFLSRLDRLENNLNRQGSIDESIKAALPELWLPLIEDSTPIILDLSDIAKPLAKKMDYLATVRDGSTGTLVNGYWLVEIYASVSRKNPMPILLEPFSHEQPLCRGQNPVIIDAVQRIFELTQKRGVLVIDRGGDARKLLDDWLDNEFNVVVRLRGDRDLMRFYSTFGGMADTLETKKNGMWIPVNARHLAETTPTPHRAWRRLGAENLFGFFSKCYERTSVIVTSNLPFSAWPEVFGDERLTGALLDRLTHRVHVIEAAGNSYRLQSHNHTTQIEMAEKNETQANTPDAAEQESQMT